MKILGYIVTRIIFGIATLAAIVLFINVINWLCNNVVFSKVLGVIAIAAVLFFIGWLVAGVIETIKYTWKKDEEE